MRYSGDDAGGLGEVGLDGVDVVGELEGEGGEGWGEVLEVLVGAWEEGEGGVTLNKLSEGVVDAVWRVWLSSSGGEVLAVGARTCAFFSSSLRSLACPLARASSFLKFS